MAGWKCKNVTDAPMDNMWKFETDCFVASLLAKSIAICWNCLKVIKKNPGFCERSDAIRLYYYNPIYNFHLFMNQKKSTNTL